ncbi:MAG TPA: hypothetical protein DHV20_08760 [Brochothrix thermosphacta]|nr:hypothetical protein [Brochothrix thermosphacta]
MGCGISQFAQMLAKLTEPQKKWVVEMGFEELLYIRVNHIDATFGYWIMSRFDPDNLELKIRDNYYVKIDEETISWVLGLNSGKHLLLPNNSSKLVDIHTKRQYKQNTSYGAVTESEVYSKIIDCHIDKISFKKHFLLYALGTLLCPTQKCGWISPIHITVLDKASEATKYNWAAYVLDWLVKYGEKFKNSIQGYGGCTLLLLVSYNNINNKHSFVYENHRYTCT